MTKKLNINILITKNQKEILHSSLNKDFQVQELIEIIYKIDKDLIKAVKVFDVYEGGNIPKEKKSIALNVTIQSSEKTLKGRRFRKELIN